MSHRLLRCVLALAIVASAPACATDAGPSDRDAEFGMDGPLEPTPPPGKDDAPNRRGLWVNTNTTRTQVWTARNRWEDTDTAAALEAGVAWGEGSGLSWDEKYARWIDSLERIESEAGYYDTFLLTTPWGKTVPSPALECAEMSIFLRVTFAAWYELPWFMEAVDRHGQRVYFGHNGVRTASGRYASTPEYAVRYRDHSTLAPAAYQASWPRDESLRRRALWGGTDEQPMLGEGATFGTYVDEIHLNKRAGHFSMLALGYLGSVNLADAANTYNIVPEAVRAGDTLLERWQRHGIGHTLVVKQVTPLGESNLDVALVSGSMPRRQGKWESGVASKRYFTDERTGGEGENVEGERYAALGGGLKRWRVTKNVGGYWTNTWMSADEAHWINSADYPRLAARPGVFDELLGEVSPEQQRDATLAIIEDARRHLREYPASCAARERRESAFAELYDLMEREFATPPAEVDRRHRALEDYVFAELEYAQSKTCCWNSTTSAMYAIAMGYAERERERAASEGTCVAPTVFMSHGDGYERWRGYAAETGRAAQWVAWSEDEACPQRDAAADVEREHGWEPWCALGAAPADGCADRHEPNDSRGAAVTTPPGTHDALAICEADEDWFAVPAGGTVRISFSHAAGDLDLAAYDATGRRVQVSQSVTDGEQVTVPAGGTARVYGYGGATGTYALAVGS